MRPVRFLFFFLFFFFSPITADRAPGGLLTVLRLGDERVIAAEKDRRVDICHQLLLITYDLSWVVRTMAALSGRAAKGHKALWSVFFLRPALRRRGRTTLIQEFHVEKTILNRHDGLAGKKGCGTWRSPVVPQDEPPSPKIIAAPRRKKRCGKGASVMRLLDRGRGRGHAKTESPAFVRGRRRAGQYHGG